MQAGRLNEIITIETPMKKPNEMGEIMDNKYIKKFTTKAEVNYKSGKRMIDNNEIFIAYDIQFIIRIYHDVDETERVIYNNKKYQINSIETDKKFQLIKLNCNLINE